MPARLAEMVPLLAMAPTKVEINRRRIPLSCCASSVPLLTISPETKELTSTSTARSAPADGAAGRVEDAT